MGERGEMEEKFSICRFRLKKVKKVDKLRSGNKKICDAGARHMPNQESGYAAGLPGGCHVRFPTRSTGLARCSKWAHFHFSTACALNLRKGAT